MRNFRLIVFVAIYVAALSGFLQPVFAQDTAPQEKSVDERIEALDQKVKILERRLELEQENAAAKAKETPLLIVGREGFFLKSADGDLLLRIGGHLQVDGRYFIDDPQNLETNTFLLRVARPILEGTIFKYYDFRVMPDFGQGTTVLQDGYLDIHYLQQIRLRAGKFKTPFGIERLQNETDLLFMERALPNNLVPNRDVGFMLHGAIREGVFNYALSVLNGVPDGGSGDIDVNNGKDYGARVFVQPFKFTGIVPLQGLGLGFATTYGNQRGTVSAPTLPTFLTPGQISFFKYLSNGTVAGTTIADGDRFRISPQGYYYWGPFGLLGEYVRSSQEVSNAANKTRLTNDAWQVALSWVLTGEDASYRDVKSKNVFDPFQGTWGAFELAVRYAQLNVDSAAFPVYANPAVSARKAEEYGVGLNWYLNRNLKVMVNFEDTRFKGGATGGDRENEKVVMNRFQIVF